jgi:serine/threonine protein kinase
MQRIHDLGGHRHIVTYLSHGLLPNGASYLDTEMCNMSLGTRIYGTIMGEAHTWNPPGPSFVNDVPSFANCGIIWNIMQQLAEGLAYIHGCNIVHMNLQPHNGEYQLFLLLIATVLYSTGVWKIAGSAYAEEQQVVWSKVIGNCRRYWFPEALNVPFELTTSIDIWSLGCILYELVVCANPFTTQAEVEHYCEIEQIEIPKAKTFGLVHNRIVTDAIRSMLQLLPSSRPTAETLRNAFQVQATTPFNAWTLTESKAPQSSDTF